jgi:hypothetical protein
MFQGVITIPAVAPEDRVHGATRRPPSWRSYGAAQRGSLASLTSLEDRRVIGLHLLSPDCPASLQTAGLWTVSLSLLSAPWLVLAFAIGCAERRAGRAALVGLVATLAALAGYFLMIMGPFEGGQSSLNWRELHGLLLSNGRNIGGGLVTGPLFGFLGQRWRTRRAWMSAVFVVGALCLEPLAQTLAGNHYRGASYVWAAEVLVGLAMAAHFVLARRHDGGGMAGPEIVWDDQSRFGDMSSSPSGHHCR